MERWQDCSETVLMSTRGGTRYDTTFREGFIRPGRGALNWKTRTTYALQGVVPTGIEEMSIYVTRAAGTPSWHVRRYVLRVDGFASVNAPYSGGEMVTRLFTFSGRELVLNYSTSAAGSVRVEIQDAAGKPVPGLRPDRLHRDHRGPDRTGRVLDPEAATSPPGRAGRSGSGSP